MSIEATWLRTHGVNTNGADKLDEIYQINVGGKRDFEVMSFDRLGEKDTPWHFWEDKSRLTGVPKKSLCQQT